LKSYDELLDNVYLKIPSKTSSGERFEIPVFDCFTQGNKTVVKNFDEVCSKLRRKPEELAKYLSKEIAVPGTLEGARLMLSTKVHAKIVNEKLVNFCELRVLCKECGKPDTHIEQGEGRSVGILICEACGARRPVRN
jgi:translation initiation factor 2 subunit 2